MNFAMYNFKNNYKDHYIRNIANNDITFKKPTNKTKKVPSRNFSTLNKNNTQRINSLPNLNLDTHKDIPEKIENDLLESSHAPFVEYVEE